MPCPPSPRPGETSVAESLACEPVWEFARRHPDLGVRVYRTAAGLRVIVTGAAAPPSSDRARELLTELGSDPLYVELCATHDSYRARLTPKPFRVGERALAVSWPFADDAARSAYEEWVSEYDGRASGHAVCRLVSASGPVPGPDEQRLVAAARRAVPGGGAAAARLSFSGGSRALVAPSVLPSDGGRRGVAGRPTRQTRSRHPARPNDNGTAVAVPLSMAEDGGFEPPRVLSQHDFQSCALGHYANPPRVRLLEGDAAARNRRAGGRRSTPAAPSPDFPGCRPPA